MSEHRQTEGYACQEYTEINPLTGIYYNHTFLKMVDKYMQNVQPDTHMMVAVDLEHFRLFNKLYGRNEGDALIMHIAECLKELQASCGGVVGYMGGDNFGAILPKRMDLLEILEKDITKGIRRLNNTVGFLPVFGVYIIDDVSLAAATMYDRATIALSYILGNQMKRVSEYNSDMEEKVEEELKLLSEIQDGLDKEEFTFFIQPQCDISTGKIVGGESLVRWKRGDKMISPGVFIPVLEKNGLIAELDRYVWRKVCQWLRRWIDRGYQPVPVSINVSRIDIFSMDVANYLEELIKEYDLPSSLLKVEITESAYAENNDKIIRAVKQLRDSSFLVMMDDFGSGYSSLNMLKSIAVDVLKIDMRFLEIGENEEEKGIGILESVVNMARQMKLPIIVEGVETQTQENFLLKMGCRYTQGYYYYKPLPIENFENLIADERRVDYDGIWCKQVEQMHVREFLDNNLFNDTMVNNIIGPAAFYEMYDNKIEITRVNEQYYNMAGIKAGREEEYGRKFWNHVSDEDRQLSFVIFEQAYDNPVSGAEGYVHYIRMDGKIIWVHIKVFFLRETNGRKIFYSSLRDVTFLEEKKKESRTLTYMAEEFTDKERNLLDNYYGNLPCGYAIGKVLLNVDGEPYDYEMMYANSEMLKTSGGDIERFRYIAYRLFQNSTEELLNRAYRAAYLGEEVKYYTYSPITGKYLEFTFYKYQKGYAACIMRDVTHIYIHETALDSIIHSYRKVYFVHLEDNYCRMIYPDENKLLERGNYEELVNRQYTMGIIRPYDEKNIRKNFSLENLKRVLKNQDSVEYKYKRSLDDRDEEWCLATYTVSEREKGEPKTVILTIRSIEALMREKEEYKRQQMAKTLANMSDGFFVYNATGDEKILYANPTVLKIYGCDTMDEFRELVDNSFKGMVHPEDLDRVECEIVEQIMHSDKKMDYIRYRITRKDGEIRWIDDCGHLEDAGSDEDAKLFYVFISDITETIGENEKEKLINLSKNYNE